MNGSICNLTMLFQPTHKAVRLKSPIGGAPRCPVVQSHPDVLPRNAIHAQADFTEAAADK